MKSGNESFKIIFWVVLLLFSCNEEKQPNSALESYNPLEGIWVNKDFIQGSKDTVITFYQFFADSQFEYGQTAFSNGQYEDTLLEGGSYLIPASNLLFLSYEYQREGANQYTPIAKNDTFVYTPDNFIDLILWGTSRTFKQISGQPGKLWHGTFYNITKYHDVYLHNKFEFKEDSVYFYSNFTTELKEPDEWVGPFRYLVRLFGPLMTFYTKDGAVGTNGYAIYKSNLIFTYTKERYRRKF